MYQMCEPFELMGFHQSRMIDSRVELAEKVSEGVTAEYRCQVHHLGHSLDILELISLENPDQFICHRFESILLILILLYGL